MDLRAKAGELGTIISSKKFAYILFIRTLQGLCLIKQFT